MKSLRQKIAGTLLADLLEAPAEQAWANLSDVLRTAEGPSVYERELIPGFEGTLGSELLWRPAQEEAEELSEEKNERRRTKRLLTQLSKIGRAVEGRSWEYEPGGRQQYSTEGNPPGRDYSEKRDRDNRSGQALTWDQSGPAFYNESQTSEPPLLNQQNYNTSTTHIYRQ